MDYLLDRYFFSYLPFGVTAETRKFVGQKALTLVQWADWLCKYESPVNVFQNNPYFFAAELLFLFLCLLTFLHAYRYGGRYLYTWIGLTIYAFIFEYLPLSVPDLNVFWHARGVLSFFGMRVPLYALFGIHQTFGYIAYVLVKRLRLPWWAEGPGVGVTSVMLLLPYRLVGTKLLWWTWHDTDPTLSDRMFWTPWFWFYFYAACMCSFVWVLHFSRCILLEEEYDWKKCPREIFCPLLAGVLSYWLANIQVSILYCPLHDIFGVHSEIITILLLSCYSLVVVITDRKNLVAEARKASRFWFDELSCAIVLEYTFLLLLVLIAEPSSIVSEGIHQPIGPCEEMENISTHSSVFEREKYLCATNYDEKYFDFHCVPNGVPKEHHDIYEKTALEYYTVCGTEFDNRAEYVIVIGGCCFLFGLILHQMAACSGSTPLFPIKSRKHIAGNTTSFRDNTIRNQETKQTRHEVQPTEHDDTMTSSQCLIPESIEADVGIRRKHTKPTNASKVGKALSRRKSTEMRSSARVLRSYSHM